MDPTEARVLKNVEVRALIPENEHRDFKALVAQLGTNLQQRLLDLVRRDLKEAKDQPAKK